MTRLSEEIKELEKFIKELGQIAPAKLEDYKSSLEKKAACERYVEKIVESLTDLAFLMIKEKRLKMPESDTDAFNILMENKIIDATIAANLKKAKGMRNIIAHQYGSIDDEIVFEAVTRELGRDAGKFIKAIEK